MKKLIIPGLCISIIHIQASEIGDRSIGGSFKLSSSHRSSSPDLQDVRLDMNEFEASLPLGHNSFAASPLTSSTSAARLVTQIAHGTTSSAPTFLTKHLRNILIEIETEDVSRFSHMMNELMQHRTRAIVRSKRNLPLLDEDSSDDHAEPPADPTIMDPTTLGTALQTNVPASVVHLITSAAAASNAEQISVTDAQAVTITQEKVKFWVVLGAGAFGTLSAIAVNIILALGAKA